MKFKPFNNTVLLKRINKLEHDGEELVGYQMVDNGGIIQKQFQVDTYEVIDLSPNLLSEKLVYKPGDIVVACATGTRILDEYVLMDADYITAKVVS